MTQDSDRIEKLIQKLEHISRQQENSAREIKALRDEINSLRTAAPASASRSAVSQTQTVNQPVAPPTGFISQNQRAEKFPNTDNPSLISKLIPLAGRNLENFIGENLISKIGIIITVIGVAIGAKFSIEHQLISPLTRIVLGYVAGIILFVLGIRLKEKYKNYSSILVSGAMAIAYFITYFAYSFYNLMPQTVAFMLMVVFTAVTIAAALSYDRQVIAHIGIVGAYAVPFLLSDGSGKVLVLFTYIAILNIGILIIALKKYWKLVLYSSFFFTWLIFLAWYFTKYQLDTHYTLTLVFATVYFAIFYSNLLVNKLIQNQKLDVGDFVLILVNSFMYFGVGYSAMEAHPQGMHLLGLFSVFNALIHTLVAIFIYFRKQENNHLLYLAVGLALVFISIAVPVQLNGNWVTLIWVGEATLLFWIGRSKDQIFAELFSYVLMILSFLSLTQDWSELNYNSQMGMEILPVFNIGFLTSILFASAFGYINILNQRKKGVYISQTQTDMASLMSFVIPGILLLSVYFAFRLEISEYWKRLYNASETNIIAKGNTKPDLIYNEDLLKFRTIWLINYTLAFLSVLSFVNYHKIKNQILGITALSVSILVIGVFLLQGLSLFGELRWNYIEQIQSQYFQRSNFNIWIRYVSYGFVAVMLIALSKFNYKTLEPGRIKMSLELLFYLSLVWIASSELINLMEISGSTQSDKLGLSILWGIYALWLIVIGIWKRKKHLRYGAIVLFSATLIKLFIYDIAYLDTISKTIVFVSLGVLLLIISFLYNKYKNVISDDLS